MKLTKTQFARLSQLTDDWRQEDHAWKSGIVFYRLEQMGLCEMQERRIRGGDVTTGPGNTSVYRWFTRRTPAGTATLTSAQRTDIEKAGDSQ